MHYRTSFPPLFIFLYNTLASKNTQIFTYTCPFFSFPLKFQFKALLNISLPLSMKSVLYLARVYLSGILGFIVRHSVLCPFFLHIHSLQLTEGWKFHLPLSLLSWTSKSPVTHLRCLLTGDIIHSSRGKRTAVCGFNWNKQALHHVLKENHTSLH